MLLQNIENLGQPENTFDIIYIIRHILLDPKPNILRFFWTKATVPAPSDYEPVASAYECAARIQAMR